MFIYVTRMQEGQWKLTALSRSSSKNAKCAPSSYVLDQWLSEVNLIKDFYLQPTFNEVIEVTGALVSPVVRER